MSDTRSAMLRRIRVARKEIHEHKAITRAYRLGGDCSRTELVALFTQRLHDYGTVVHLVTEYDLGERLTELLDGRDCVVPPGLPVEWTPPGARIDDPPLPVQTLDETGAVITAAAAACAETGTIALDGGPGQGRRALTLVPDRHLCVVRTEQIVHTVPELLARLAPTRPTTLISGPVNGQFLMATDRPVRDQRYRTAPGPRRPRPANTYRAPARQRGHDRTARRGIRAEC